MVDLVILNGKCMNFDGPDAEALAVTGGEISAVGSTAEISALAGDARVIDAKGATVLPGFIDSHVHLFSGGAEAELLNLYEVSGPDALAAAVADYSPTRPDDALLFASAIDYNIFGDRPITRHDLDAASPDRPFAAMTSDHHTSTPTPKRWRWLGCCRPRRRRRVRNCDGRRRNSDRRIVGGGGV